MPQLATIACIAFVIFLFRQDIKYETSHSRALWIPLAWMFFAGSRYPSAWVDLGPLVASMEADSEGSPFDRNVFLILITAGLAILTRRTFDWNGLLAVNKLLVLYLGFCLLSVVWSDVPQLALKRWVKDLGNPIMALIILTEPQPLRSLTQVLRRLSFLWLPLSIVFIRYYPDLGRWYHNDGSTLYTGVGQQKNALGTMCLVTGIYFIWQLYYDRATFLTWERNRRLSLYFLAAIAASLLYISDSKTSLACLLAAGAVIFASRLSFLQLDPKRLVNLLVFFAICFLTLDKIFEIRLLIFELLGRDPTLTSRTDNWSVLLGFQQSPLLGQGFMSFWSAMRSELNHLPTGVLKQAHSGYIEQYLNLGYVGVGFIVLLLLRAMLGMRTQLATDHPMAILRLSFLIMAILYNYTEAAFYGINNIWVLLWVAMIKLPEPGRTSLQTDREQLA